MIVGTIGFLSACKDDSSSTPAATDANTENSSSGVRMNEVQYLGTHNSYHPKPPDDVVFIANNLGLLPEAYADAIRDTKIDLIIPTLEYRHSSLTEQFEAQGIRQIELDVFLDPDGGRYANRSVLALLGKDPASGIAELNQPGLKVLHIQEIDYESTCYTFILCLSEIKTWSDSNPNHLPITVLIEAKDEVIPDPGIGFAIPLPFDADGLNEIDEEIRSVFPDSKLITPDSVRGDASTLEEAILTQGWPLLSDARGKIMFALDNNNAARTLYIEGHPSLSGRVMFTDSAPGTPEAAFTKFNNPVSNFDSIKDLSKRGYLVRTRADADTNEAKENNTMRQEDAFNSGAHFISTDYPVPDDRPEFNNYSVSIPGGGIARCNPVSASNACDDNAL